MKKSVILFFAVSVLASSSVFSEKISFSANSMHGKMGDKSDSTTLSGEASVITESMEIYADEILMTGRDYRYIEAKGSIRGVNVEAELEFSCEKLKFDRETKIADLSDNVRLKDVKNDVSAKAQIIQYNQKNDVAVMQIGIELTQKENVCSGVYAVYRKKDQMLEISGNAQIKQGSDTFRAQEITLDLESQEITLDGRVKGSIVDERKTEKTSSVEEPAEKDAAPETEKKSVPNSDAGPESPPNGEVSDESSDSKETGVQKEPYGAGEKSEKGAGKWKKK